MLAAFRLGKTCAAVVKHTVPCGVAQRSSVGVAVQADHSVVVGGRQVTNPATLASDFQVSRFTAAGMVANVLFLTVALLSTTAAVTDVLCRQS